MNDWFYWNNKFYNNKIIIIKFIQKYKSFDFFGILKKIILKWKIVQHEEFY